MGAKLVVGINLRGEEIASVAYRWSGFTLDSLEEIRYLIAAFAGCDTKTISKHDAQARIIKSMQLPHKYDLSSIGRFGGVYYDDLEYASAEFPELMLHTEPDDNLGVVALRGETSKKLWDAADETAEINLDRMAFCTYAWETIDDPNDADEIKCASEWRGPNLNQWFDWSEINDVIASVFDSASCYTDNTGMMIRLIR